MQDQSKPTLCEGKIVFLKFKVLFKHQLHDSSLKTFLTFVGKMWNPATYPTKLDKTGKKNYWRWKLRWVGRLHDLPWFWIDINQFTPACLQRAIDTQFFVGLISFWFALCQVLDCDFDDSTFCAWANENSEKSTFNWTLKSGQTPSRRTGPLSDVSGINCLFYIDSLAAPNVYLNFQALSLVHLR